MRALGGRVAQTKSEYRKKCQFAVIIRMNKRSKCIHSDDEEFSKTVLLRIMCGKIRSAAGSTKEDGMWDCKCQGRMRGKH